MSLFSMSLILTVRSSGGRREVPWHHRGSQGGSKTEVP
jgi:hypothetical protein